MLWLPKLFGKRCIATIHGLDHRRAKWGALARTYIMLGEKCAAKYADEIIVLSKSVQDYFREVYHRETVLIPNGVATEKTLPVAQISREFGLISRGYLLFLGRIVWYYITKEEGSLCLPCCWAKIGQPIVMLF